MMYCLYFQAQVVPQDTWFVVAILRSYEHLQFDRTCDRSTGTFEFLVPPAHEKLFCTLMDYFLKEGFITAYEQQENRLKDPNAEV